MVCVRQKLKQAAGRTEIVSRGCVGGEQDIGRLQVAVDDALP